MALSPNRYGSSSSSWPGLTRPSTFLLFTCWGDGNGNACGAAHRSHATHLYWIDGDREPLSGTECYGGFALSIQNQKRAIADVDTNDAAATYGGSLALRPV